MSDLVTASLPPGALRSLLTGGVIAGAGSVLVFLPQILVLFLFIAVLEECGYMARAAYLMDKLMSRIGLSGKSFIPLLSSFACAVPGIMAARVIENRRERLVTILIAPLMSCSARLPVYMLLIAAFIPEWRFLGGWISLQGLVMLGLYALGIATAVAVALVLKRTIFRGVTPPFVMELPGYKLPSVWNVLRRALDQGWSFVYYLAKGADGKYGRKLHEFIGEAHKTDVVERFQRIFKVRDLEVFEKQWFDYAKSLDPAKGVDMLTGHR